MMSARLRAGRRDGGGDGNGCSDGAMAPGAVDACFEAGDAAEECLGVDACLAGWGPPFGAGF